MWACSGRLPVEKVGPLSGPRPGGRFQGESRVKGSGGSSIEVQQDGCVGSKGKSEKDVKFQKGDAGRVEFSGEKWFRDEGNREGYRILKQGNVSSR